MRKSGCDHDMQTTVWWLWDVNDLAVICSLVGKVGVGRLTLLFSDHSGTPENKQGFSKSADR